jgi:hypothetical protein
MFYGKPERTTVEKDGSTWTVSTIRDGVETIAFEEGGEGRQIDVFANGHEAAVEKFKAMVID